MKKLLSLSFMVLFALGLSAQEYKMWVAGSIGYSSSDKGPVKSSEITVGPEFAYLLNESLAIGINLTFNNFSTKNANNSTETKDDEIGVNLFLRKYKSLAENFALFGQFNVGYFSGGSKTDDNLGAVTKTTETTYTGFDVNIRPGVQYWVYPTLSIIATIGELGYRSRTDKDADFSEDSSDLDININGNLGFGLVWHF